MKYDIYFDESIIVILQVSRQSKHLLNLLSLKPIICLKEINPALFNFVEDLRDVRVSKDVCLIHYF